MSKPKQYWLEADREEGEPYLGYEVSRPPNPNYKQKWIHVIDYAAYADAKQMCAELALALRNTIYDAERLEHGEFAVQQVNEALAKYAKWNEGI